MQGEAIAGNLGLIDRPRDITYFHLSPAMGSTGGSSLVPTSPSPSSLSRTFTFPSDVKGVLRIWDSVISSTLDRYRNGTVNWSQVVFLTTCFVAMVGCGFLSSLLRRRGVQPPSDGRGRRFGRSARKNDRKSSAGAMSSSDEDEYDSNMSLRPGTDSSLSEKDATGQHREQSVEGQSYFLCWLLRCDLILNESSPYHRPRSPEEVLFVPLLLDIRCDLSVYQDVLLSASADEQVAYQTITNSDACVCARPGRVPGAVPSFAHKLDKHCTLLWN